MSTTFTTSTGIEIGSRSARPLDPDGTRHKRFTWHVTPLVFYRLGKENMIIQNDSNQTCLSFDAFVALVSLCDLQEVKLKQKEGKNE